MPWKAEAGGSLSLGPAWPTEQVPGQPRLVVENLFQSIFEAIGIGSISMLYPTVFIIDTLEGC